MRFHLFGSCSLSNGLRNFDGLATKVLVTSPAFECTEGTGESRPYGDQSPEVMRSAASLNAKRILSGRPTTGPFPRPWEWRVAASSFSKIFSLRGQFSLLECA